MIKAFGLQRHRQYEISIGIIMRIIDKRGTAANDILEV
jgi:hypothetical protein